MTLTTVRLRLLPGCSAANNTELKSNKRCGSSVVIRALKLLTSARRIGSDTLQPSVAVLAATSSCSACATTASTLPALASLSSWQHRFRIWLSKDLVVARAAVRDGMSGRLLRSELVEAGAARGGGEGHSVACAAPAGVKGSCAKSSLPKATTDGSWGTISVPLRRAPELSQDKERGRSLSLLKPTPAGAGAILSRLMRSCESQESDAGVTGLLDERSSSCRACED